MCLIFISICPEKLKGQEANVEQKLSTNSKVDHYVAVHVAAGRAISVALEFEKTFQDVDHFIVEFELHGNGIYEWQSTGYFANRFEVVMTQSVEIDYGAMSIKPIGDPKFFVFEILNVGSNRRGRLTTQYGDQWKFTVNEWAEFQKSNDFTLLMFSSTPVKPVKRIRDHIEKVRKPRIPISLIPAAEQTTKAPESKERKQIEEKSTRDNASPGTKEID